MNLFSLSVLGKTKPTCKQLMTNRNGNKTMRITGNSGFMRNLEDQTRGSTSNERQDSVPPISETENYWCLSCTSLAWPQTNPTTWVLTSICCFSLGQIQPTSCAKLLSMKPLQHGWDNRRWTADNKTQQLLMTVTHVLLPVKLTDFHSFLNQSNCNTCEMMLCEQKHLKVKHQFPAVRRSWLSTESNPCCSIHYTDNTGKQRGSQTNPSCEPRFSSFLFNIPISLSYFSLHRRMTFNRQKPFYPPGLTVLPIEQGTLPNVHIEDTLSSTQPGLQLSCPRCFSQPPPELTEQTLQ